MKNLSRYIKESEKAERSSANSDTGAPGTHVLTIYGNSMIIEKRDWPVKMLPLTTSPVSRS
jgi:hypothetical protein